MTPEEIQKLETDNKALTEANKKLTAENEKLTKAKDSLVEQNKALNTANTTLTADNKTLKKTGEEKDAQLTQAGKVVQELKEQLATKTKGTVQKPVVEHDGHTYELVGGGFFFDNQVVTHEVLKEDPKLVAKLIGERVGNLRKIEE
jgi:DNA repair exonuclease SbcCD ATPase subunit